MKNNFLIQDGLLERYLSLSTEIEIPDGVSIISCAAFYESPNLKSVKIPQSVTSIFCEFTWCKKLECIVVDENNPRYDSRNNCNAIIETVTNTLVVGCKNTIIPDGVMVIGAEAFAGRSGVIDIKIPDSVTKIEASAFECCGLRSIFIPKNVVGIALDAFAGCSHLERIVVEGGNPRYDSRDNCNAIVETATNILVVGCKNTVIPKSVLFIADEAFLGQEDMTDIIIPDTIFSIGEDAFLDSGDQLTIHCHVGSYAEKYAKEQGILYELIEDEAYEIR